jgi:2-methylisocitrate lyase-like PEP mutase family enzyme
LPANARVLVVSRGDESIVDFEHHRGEHFPQAANGTYAGHHPADSAEAIRRLEALREDGAEFLVIPGTSAWWIEHYEGFARHLDRYPRSAAEDGAHVVYALGSTTEVAA